MAAEIKLKKQNPAGPWTTKKAITVAELRKDDNLGVRDNVEKRPDLRHTGFLGCASAFRMGIEVMQAIGGRSSDLNSPFFVGMGNSVGCTTWSWLELRVP